MRQQIVTSSWWLLNSKTLDPSIITEVESINATENIIFLKTENGLYLIEVATDRRSDAFSGGKLMNRSRNCNHMVSIWVDIC